MKTKSILKVVGLTIYSIICLFIGWGLCIIFTGHSDRRDVQGAMGNDDVSQYERVMSQSSTDSLTIVGGD